MSGIKTITQATLKPSTKKGTCSTLQFLGTSSIGAWSIFKICTMEGKNWKQPCVQQPTDVWMNHHTQNMEDDSALEREILPCHHMTNLRRHWNQWNKPVIKGQWTTSPLQSTLRNHKTETQSRTVGDCQRVGLGVKTWVHGSWVSLWKDENARRQCGILYGLNVTAWSRQNGKFWSTSCVLCINRMKEKMKGIQPANHCKDPESLNSTHGV